MKLTFILTTVLLSMALSNSSQANESEDERAYLFSYFRGNGETGLHLAWSRDGLDWTALNDGRSFLRPEIGGRLMRDPCITEGPDGTFHMVWTTGWWDQTIGLAHSEDLINWSEQQLVPVMKHEEEALNSWAPEILYDPVDESFLIHWATTIPGKFPLETEEGADRNPEGKALNHRMYYTRTTDFEEFTEAEILYEPGFNSIDANIVPANDHWLMFIKDETAGPNPEKNIRMARADEPGGPWGAAGEPISPDWVEGPTALEIDGVWYVYYDAYTRGRYEGVRSKDLEEWEDITDKLNFPRGARHGTVFEVDSEVLERLLEWDKNRSE